MVQRWFHWRALALLAVAVWAQLCLLSCVPSFTDVPIVQSSLGVPLYDTTLTLGSFVAQSTGSAVSGLQRDGTNGNLAFVLEQRLPPVLVGDNLRLDSTNVAFAASINDRPEVSGSVTDIGTFSATFRDIFGMNPPPVPFTLPAGQHTVNVNIPLPDSIVSARLQGGTLTIRFTNTFPVALTLIAPQNQRSEGVLLTSPTANGRDTTSFLPLASSPAMMNATIAAGSTRTLSFTIQAGTLLAQRLSPRALPQMVFRISVPQTTAQFPASSSLTGALAIQNPVLQSAELTLQPRSIRLETFSPFASGAVLSRAVLRRFAGTLEVHNPFPFAADNATLTLPQIRENGLPYAQAFSLRARGTSTILLGQANPARGNNRYELFDDGRLIEGLRAVVTLQTGVLSGVFPNDSIRARGRIEASPVLEIEGTRLPTTVISVQQAVAFSVGEGLRNLGFTGANAGLLVDTAFVELQLRNQANVEGRASGTLNLLTRSGASVLGVGGTSGVSFAPQLVNPASIQRGMTTIQLPQSSLRLTALPDSARVSARIETVNNRLQRFHAKSTDTIDGIARLRIPLRVRLTGAQYRDTAELTIPQAVLERERNLRGGTLVLEVENGVPLALAATVRFIGIAGTTVLTLPKSSALTIAAPQVATNGLPTATARSVNRVELSADDIRALFSARRYSVELLANTPPQTSQFLTSQAVRLRAFITVNGTTE